jgi:hypothetical protein
MDLVGKTASYLFVGAILVAVNLLFARAVYKAFIRGGELVIAPFKVVKDGTTSPQFEETLARMLVARIRETEWNLKQWQTSLQRIGQESNPGIASGAIEYGSIGVPALFATPRTAGITAQLFAPVNIDVKVGGVDVGGIFTRIQQWFAEDQALNFSVSVEGHTAIIAGDIGVLGEDPARPLWIELNDASPQSITDALAHALIKRVWAKDTPDLGELTEPEFRTLVDSVGTVASINRRVTKLHVPAKSDFERVLSDIGVLADKIPSWDELNYFAATIAEGAGNYGRALIFYQHIKDSKTPSIKRELLDAKMNSVNVILGRVTNESTKSTLELLNGYADYATRILNRLFEYQLPSPNIELVKELGFYNAYWDGKKISVPPESKDIPDLIYFSTARRFLAKAWSYEDQGQAGALAVSFCDVLASLIKQTKANQTAQEADWTIAPGFVAWVTGKSDSILSDRRPLRSMKAPGTAYDEPMLGKDQQPGHFRDIVITNEDKGGVSINSGIPNKAFYETAIKIGSEKAGNIWIKSLHRFGPKTDLPEAAQIISHTAVELYGENSLEVQAVDTAFTAVGLSPKADQHVNEREIRDRPKLRGKNAASAIGKRKK